MTQPAIINFGTCWGTPNGQDLSSPSYMASGFLIVAEAILRRWSATQGRLIDDPNYGYNLTDLIGDDLSSDDMRSAEQLAGVEAQKDPRVLACTVTLTFVDNAVTVRAKVTTAAGPFQLVASVSAIGVSNLQVSQ
jgi:hypothetical protein